MDIKEESLGKKIRLLREKKDWSQSKLARQSNLSNEYIGKIERGQAENIGIKTLELIANALQADWADLMTFEDAITDRGTTNIKDKKLSNVTPYKLNEIPLLSGTVSAGAFTSSLNDWAGERIAMPVEKPANKVGWRISGHSMSPDYNDGDIAVIAHGVRFSDGDDIVAENHKGVTIKRLKYLKDGSIELRPLNPDYPTLTFKKGDDLEILGVVVGLYRKMKK